LLEQKKADKEIGRAALDVDGFGFEVSRSRSSPPSTTELTLHASKIERVTHELVTVKKDLKELAVLYDQALAVPSSTSARCAATNRLAENLDTLKKRISNTFSPLPPILRTLDARAPHLHGGAGRAFVLTSETEGVKQQLRQAAKLMKECIDLIDAGVTRGARLDKVSRKVSIAEDASDVEGAESILMLTISADLLRRLRGDQVSFLVHSRNLVGLHCCTNSTRLTEILFKEISQYRRSRQDGHPLPRQLDCLGSHHARRQLVECESFFLLPVPIEPTRTYFDPLAAFRLLAPYLDRHPSS